MQLISAHKNRQNNSMVHEDLVFNYHNLKKNQWEFFYFILFYFIFLSIYLHCDFLVCDNIMSHGMNIMHVTNLFNMLMKLQQLHPSGMIIFNKIKEHKSLFSTILQTPINLSFFSLPHAVWTLRVAVRTLRVAVWTLVVLWILTLLTLTFILQRYFSTSTLLVKIYIIYGS